MCFLLERGKRFFGAGVLAVCFIVFGAGAARSFEYGSTGEADDPYRIETLDHLNQVRNDLSAHYILMKDIDASDTENWNGGDGWEPIGNPCLPFTGTFDGNGYEISDLYINRGDNNIGLFGSLGAWDVEAEITDVTLVDVDITGSSTVGGLAGNLFNGNITNSSAAGVVVVIGSTVGGLVGENWGNITNSYAEVDVRGDNQVGGLVGNNKGTILNSYSTGNVTYYDDPLSAFFGGLVGENEGGTIKNSYSTGAVEGVAQVGGLVGATHGGGTIKNSHSTGNVEGTDNVGGLVGFSVGEITNSFWNIESSGQTESHGGAGKTTAEMQDISTFEAAGWSIGERDADPNDGYPYLAWQLNGSSHVWYIYEGPDPDPDPDPDPEPRPRPRPEPEPEPPLPPVNFGGIPGEQAFDAWIELSWNESPSPGIVQYNLYASTYAGSSSLEAASDDTQGMQFWLLEEFSPDVFEYTHSGLSRNVKYYYVITSLDEEGLESAVTPEVLWFIAGTGEYGTLDAIDWGPHRIIDEPEADDSSTFFIATAAYGSAMSSKVVSLRNFRDGFLLSNGAGSRLVEAYYSASPVFAGAIAESGILRKVARLHLAPFVRFSGFLINMN